MVQRECNKVMSVRGVGEIQVTQVLVMSMWILPCTGFPFLGTSVWCHHSSTEVVLVFCKLVNLLFKTYLEHIFV